MKIRRQAGITNQKDLPGEMIYADDYEHITDDKEMNKLFIKKLKLIVRVVAKTCPRKKLTFKNKKNFKKVR